MTTANQKKRAEKWLQNNFDLADCQSLDNPNPVIPETSKSSRFYRPWCSPSKRHHQPWAAQLWHQLVWPARQWHPSHLEQCRRPPLPDLSRTKLKRSHTHRGLLPHRQLRKQLRGRRSPVVRGLMVRRSGINRLNSLNARISSNFRNTRPSSSVFRVVCALPLRHFCGVPLRTVTRDALGPHNWCKR